MGLASRDQLLMRTSIVLPLVTLLAGSVDAQSSSTPFLVEFGDENLPYGVGATGERS